MRVSIGLPVYNGENYLRSSIDSILSQTYSDFELIISDNASIDSTASIIAEYAAKDKRIRCFRQDRNIGLSRNTNFVFAQARGEYFKWVSHDDIHSPDFVQKCVAVLDADPTAVLACPRGVIIDKDGHRISVKRIRRKFYGLNDSGEILGEMRPFDPPRSLHSTYPHKRFREMLLKTGWCLEIYGLMRSHILRQTGLNGDFYGGDKPLLAEMCLRGRFVEVPEDLLYYRQHPAQEQLYRSSASLRQRYATGSGEVTFEIPRYKLLRAYWTGLSRAPISKSEYFLCSSSIAFWFFQLRKWPGLVVELYRERSFPRNQQGPSIERLSPSSPRELEKLI